MGKLNRTEEERTIRDGCYNPRTIKKLEIYLKKLEDAKDKSVKRRNGSNR